LGRRAFLGVVGLGLTSLAWGGAVADLLSRGSSALPEGVRKAVPFGQGWRIYWVNKPFPVFRKAEWRLRVDGLVEEPLDLSWEEFLALPQRKQVSDFHCVTGWSVDQVPWTGVGLAELMAIAKPLPSAAGLEFISAEQPYVDTLTMAQAAMPDVLLAHQMDGQPLPREHGAPVRVVIPKMYGYKGVKWLARIRVVDAIEPGYWEQRGYDTDAWVGNSNGL
jgi:DMSO/TMAO reductase YedYZ molybdopterin-dependent catalytic subunit